MPIPDVSFLYAASASILTALAGGFIGALANGWVNRRTASKVEERELKGLLGLVLSEVKYNAALLDIAERTGDGTFIERLTCSFWESSRARLAQLLSKDALDVLMAYYVTVDGIFLFVVPWTEPLSESKRWHLQSVKQAGDKVLDIVDKYG